MHSRHHSSQPAKSPTPVPPHRSDSHAAGSSPATAVSIRAVVLSFVLPRFQTHRQIVKPHGGRLKLDPTTILSLQQVNVRRALAQGPGLTLSQIIRMLLIFIPFVSQDIGHIGTFLTAELGIRSCRVPGVDVRCGEVVFAGRDVTCHSVCIIRATFRPRVIFG